MAPPEILRQIESRNCPFVFRIVDRDEKDPGAGSAVLVSDKGSDSGFALTCWHNIDWTFAHAKDWTRAKTLPLPESISALPASEHDLLKRGEAIELMGQWSNPTHDVAVLRVPRFVITAFKLRPAPISFHVNPGALVIARGFDRPWLEASLALYRGKVPDSMDPFTLLYGTQRAFAIRLEGVFQRGLSGGAAFDIHQGALIGVANAVKPDAGRHAVARSHYETGYAASMQEVAESWTEIREYCHVVEPPDTDSKTWVLPPRVEHALPPAEPYQARPESESLRTFWTAGDGGVLGLVGVGGTGKTSLVESFLHEIKPSNDKTPSQDSVIPHAHALFVWSFYVAPYPEKCLRSLLGYLDGNRDAHAKWSLAKLKARLTTVKNPRILLVLDGLERIQHEKTIPGRLRSDGASLCDLLKWCAQGDSGVWVVVTTRLPLTDLAPWSRRAFQSVDVEPLPPVAAENLLRNLGVKGDPRELQALVEQFGGHALSIHQLGVLLSQYYDGNPRGIADLAPVLAEGYAVASDADDQARRLTRLLAEYERFLQPDELTVIKAISAFRIPIDAAALESFGSQNPPTDERFQVPTGKQLQRALAHLRALHLVFEHRDAATGTTRYSTHPAVSQYFYRALEEDALRVHMGATAYLMRQLEPGDFHVRTRGAIRTRGAKLRGPTDRFPTDPAVLDLLEEAVHHAVSAQYFELAWEVYVNRLGGFEHLGNTIGELERGLRITEMLLQYVEEQPRILIEKKLIQREHERYVSALARQRGAAPAS